MSVFEDVQVAIDALIGLALAALVAWVKQKLGKISAHKAAGGPQTPEAGS